MDTNEIKELIYTNLEYLSPLVNADDWDEVYREFSHLAQISFSVGHSNIESRVIPLLTAILLESGIDSLPYFKKKIPDYFLYDLPGQAKIRIPDIVIPDGVEEIGGLAFCRSEIKNVYIPLSVTRIETGAFADNSYVKIYYEGDGNDWSLITKRSFTAWQNSKVKLYTKSNGIGTGFGELFI